MVRDDRRYSLGSGFSMSGGGAQFALLVVLLAIAAGVFCYRSRTVRRLLRQSRADSAAEAGYKPAADVDSRVFAAYPEELASRNPVRLSIGATSRKFFVSCVPSAPGTRAFLVKPEQYFQFVSADIGELVGKGLSTKTFSGEPCPAFYGESKIVANAADRSWTVTLADVAGEGVITLDINGSRASHRVARPSIFPIWKFLQFVVPADRKGGRGSACFQGCTILERDRSRDNPKDCSFIAGNKATNVCGFRLHGVSSRCVWLEVVYYSANSSLKRRKWPDATVESRLVNGAFTPPFVCLPDGVELTAGTYPLSGGETLELPPGGILDDNAVFFEYRAADGTKIADMICVDIRPHTL